MRIGNVEIGILALALIAMVIISIVGIVAKLFGGC